ncbi:MAG: sugar phosphate isomerase/epimerase [Flavobacteriaceae bacterium]|nr:sugar phosphate isomerase/epimerase [Flavobacteriaceae bacterium]
MTFSCNPLKFISFLTLGLLTQFSVLAQDIGIQLYSLRNYFPEGVEKTIKTIADWGITKVEGGDTYGKTYEAYKSIMDQHQMETVSIGISYEELRDNPEKALAKAQQFGVKYVMCSWIPHPGNTFDFEITKAAVDVFNTAGKLFLEHGISLAYHAHGYEFRPYKEGTLFDYMAENATHFFYEMDVFWAQHGGADPLALMKKYPDFVVMMHLKDMQKGVVGNNTGSEDVETNVVLGQGQIDIEGLVREARKLGVKYMFIEDESSRVIEQVPQSLAFLKSIQ